MASPSPGISQEEQRRLQELEAARTARLFSSTESRSSNNPVSASSTTPPPQPDLTSLGLAPQPATPSAQDRQLAFLNQAPDKLSAEHRSELQSLIRISYVVSCWKKT